MNSVDDTTATEAEPIEVVIGDDTRVALGEQSRITLRREQIRVLAAAQQEVESGFNDLPELDGAEARAVLERLGSALTDASNAVAVLWWLAPDET